MKSLRHVHLDAVSASLGSRELIWGGLRADDIEGLSDLPQVAGSISVIGGHRRGGAVPSLLDFEDIYGRRVDLDAWDIEDHLDSTAAHEFREQLLGRLMSPSALLPYRSSAFLSSILFARRDRCLDLGLFGPHQAMFDHKPWVETRVAELGLRHVPWQYVADEEQFRVRRMLRDGPICLRESRSSGGHGLVRVEDPDRLTESWPHRPEAFVGVTPYLDGALPINVGATVWHDGVTLHHPSVQLIGIPYCVGHPFGYCGNDFGLAADLDDAVLAEIEAAVRAIGDWLRGYRYRGTFGVDFLLHEGAALFSEINPRFQGSTHASSQLSSEAEESCLLLDHLAAVLGHPTPRRRPWRQWVKEMPAFAHLVVHWQGPPTRLDSSSLVSAMSELDPVCRVDVVAKPGILLDPGGVVARVATRQRATRTGFELLDPYRGILADWRSLSAQSHSI